MEKEFKITVKSMTHSKDGVKEETVRVYVVNEVQLKRVQDFFADMKQKKNEAIDRMEERTRQRIANDPDFLNKLK